MQSKHKDSTMNRIIAIAFILTLLTPAIHAQESSAGTPKGKAIVQVFSNYNYQFDATATTYHGFELDRSYLGYEQQLGDGLTIKGVMDIGQPKALDDYHRVAYIKNAMVSWKHGGLTLNGGLISTTQFNFQEKFWGYRYVMKTFQDQYKFGNSADLGISTAYKICSWLSADAIIVNGEGYKKIQQNDGLSYGIGVTLTPIKGLQLRLYGGTDENGDREGRPVGNLSAFAGYKAGRLSIGAEYCQQRNSSYTAGQHREGLSLMADFRMSDKADIYLRYDEVNSSKQWDKDNDEAAAIVGMQFKLGQYVKIAPNYRIAKPRNGEPIRHAAYLSCYFGF